tara:strand:+ start:1927 stop:2487 length:561 start_codon:yes stop_codon:yes gene_type:complete
MYQNNYNKNDAAIVVDKTILKKIVTSDNKYPKPLNIIISNKMDYSSLSFNVLPKKNIKERIDVKKYHLKKRFIEAIFDRKYSTDMIHSPDHLIFLSSLIQLQKMIYIYLCYEFDLNINLNEKEKLKIWPTNINIDMPRMITKKTNLSQKIKIKNLRKLNSQSYFGKCESNIDGIIHITADAMISIV